MQCGVLTGKVTKEWAAALPQSDWRKSKLQYIQEPRLSAVIELVDELKMIAAQSDHAVSQLAVSWVIAQPGLTSAIVGARKKGQIRETAAAADWTLCKDELEAVERACAAYESRVASGS
jgi:aryl-alcohol dehydrogenase-like predicted oxidoreductase